MFQILLLLIVICFHWAHSSPLPTKQNHFENTATQHNIIIPPVGPKSLQNEHSRNRRTLLFRPLFVYRQQQIKKQHLLAQYAHHSTIPSTSATHPYYSQTPSPYYPTPLPYYPNYSSHAYYQNSPYYCPNPYPYQYYH